MKKLPDDAVRYYIDTVASDPEGFPVTMAAERSQQKVTRVTIVLRHGAFADAFELERRRRAATAVGTGTQGRWQGPRRMPPPAK